MSHISSISWSCNRPDVQHDTTTTVCTTANIVLLLLLLYIIMLIKFCLLLVWNYSCMRGKFHSSILWWSPWTLFQAANWFSYQINICCYLNAYLSIIGL